MYKRFVYRFNLTMDPNLDIGSLATCTTCRFKEDKSNYWTAVMYFKHPNGTYFRVPQIPNHFVGTTNGGMTVYYVQPGGQKVTAFPKVSIVLPFSSDHSFIHESTYLVDRASE